jgi:hypothetical protein
MLEAQTTSGWLLARASRREAMPTLQEFTDELKTQLRQAELKNSTYLEINSGDFTPKAGQLPCAGRTPNAKLLRCYVCGTTGW